MQQTDRGNYRTRETATQKFLHSCLGQLIIAGAVLAAVLVVAHMTVPDEETAMLEMDDNIRQCIEANDSLKTDWIDDAVNNVGYIFTTADSITNREIIDNFVDYNTLSYHRYPFHSTVLIHNNFKPDGIRIGIGIFGVVIPTVTFNDFLFKIGPMHKGYDQKPVRSTIITGSDNWSNNPELGL